MLDTPSSVRVNDKTVTLPSETRATLERQRELFGKHAETSMSVSLSASTLPRHGLHAVMREIVDPLSLPVDLCEDASWPWSSLCDGALFWLSNVVTGDETAAVMLHRLELQCVQDAPSGAAYSCRRMETDWPRPDTGLLTRLFKRPAVHPRGQPPTSLDNVSILANYPVGPLGGRDSHPVLWLGASGRIVEFDARTLHRRASHVVPGAEFAMLLSDVDARMLLAKCRGDARRAHGRYELRLLQPGLPRVASFMMAPSETAPLAVSARCVGCAGCGERATGDKCDKCAEWIVVGTQTGTMSRARLLLHVVSRQQGRLMAVFQSASAPIRQFVSLRTGSDEESLVLLALLENGSVRRYTLSRLSVETARFDGAAGLLRVFPVAEFETVADGPFAQIVSTEDGGFVARTETALVRLLGKLTVDGAWAPGGVVLSRVALLATRAVGVLVVDVLSREQQLWLLDAQDLRPVARIALPHLLPSASTAPVHVAVSVAVRSDR